MLVIECVVHLYLKITSVSYFMGCESICKKTRFCDCMGCASVREDNQCKLLYVLCICTGR